MPYGITAGMSLWQCTLLTVFIGKLEKTSPYYDLTRINYAYALEKITDLLSVAPLNQLIILGPYPSQCRFGVLILDIVDIPLKNCSGARCFQRHNVLVRHDGEIDEKRHSHQNDATRNPEQETQDLVKPTKNRFLHKR